MVVAPQPSLENFVVGENAHALTQIRALLEARGERTIHLWGPSGAGKTHLLRASAAALSARGLVCLELFAPGPAAPAGRAELVLCDDIDRLDARAQLEAFALLNEARLQGARILTAAASPAGGLALREDLRTRVGQSLPVGLQPLAEADKRNAMAEHAASLGLELSEELLGLVLARAPRDMRTLIAVIDAINRQSLALKRPATAVLVREVLHAIRPPLNPGTPHEPDTGAF